MGDTVCVFRTHSHVPDDGLYGRCARPSGVDEPTSRTSHCPRSSQAPRPPPSACALRSTPCSEPGRNWPLWVSRSPEGTVWRGGWGRLFRVVGFVMVTFNPWACRSQILAGAQEQPFLELPVCLILTAPCGKGQDHARLARVRRLPLRSAPASTQTGGDSPAGGCRLTSLPYAQP